MWALCYFYIPCYVATLLMCPEKYVQRGGHIIMMYMCTTIMTIYLQTPYGAIYSQLAIIYVLFNLYRVPSSDMMRKLHEHIAIYIQKDNFELLLIHFPYLPHLLIGECLLYYH